VTDLDSLSNPLDDITMNIYVLDCAIQIALDSAEKKQRQFLTSLNFPARPGQCFLRQGTSLLHSQEQGKKAAEFFVSYNRTYNALIFAIAHHIKRTHQFQTTWIGSFSSFKSLEEWRNLDRFVELLNDVRSGLLSDVHQSPFISVDTVAARRRDLIVQTSRKRIQTILGIPHSSKDFPIRVWMNPMAPENSGVALQLPKFEFLITGPTRSKEDEDLILVHEAAHLPVYKFARQNDALRSAIKRSVRLYDNMPISPVLRASYASWPVYFEEVMVRAITRQLVGRLHPEWEFPLEADLEIWMQRSGDIGNNVASGLDFLDLYFRGKAKIR
jgi:hypothetical protein